MAFKPVKSDILGNVKKLEAVQQKDKERYKTFTDMLEHEKEQGTHGDSKSASIALLWLKRALKYICVLLEQIVADEKKEESLVPHVKKAYKDSLEMYHGFMVKNVFKMCCHAAPYRKDLVKNLAGGEEGKDDEVIKDMQEFVAVLGPNIIAIHDLIKRLDLDSDSKV